MSEPAPQPSPAPPPFPLGRRGVIVFSLSAAVVFAGLAWALTRFYRGVPFSAIFAGGWPFAAQFVVGGLAGAAAGAVIAAMLLHIRRIALLRTLIRGILARLRPTVLEIFTVSLAAGFSEELLFRGTLQPMWGLWLASLLFGLSHVGGNVFTWPKLGFAAYVFAMGVLFGLLYAHAGLVAAMTAHAACNASFLMLLMRDVQAGAA